MRELPSVNNLMSFSGSRSSFRNTTVRSFIEDNEKILKTLDFGSAANSEKGNYSEWGDNSSECFPSLKQSILDFTERHGMTNLHNSLLSPEERQNAGGPRSRASSEVTSNGKQSESGKNSVSARTKGDSMSVSSKRSLKSNRSVTDLPSQRKDTASVASRQSRTENIEAMSNCSRSSKRSQRDDRSFKTADLETGSVASRRSRQSTRSRSATGRRMTDKESTKSGRRESTVDDDNSVANLRLNAMIPYGSPDGKASSNVSGGNRQGRSSRAASVRSSRSAAKMSTVSRGSSRQKSESKEPDALVKSQAANSFATRSYKGSKTPSKSTSRSDRVRLERHDSLEDSYKVYLSNKQKLITEKWAREDAARNEEEDLLDDYEIFMRYVRKPYVFTGKKRTIVDVYPGYQEEEYEYIRVPPNIPENPSDRMKERMAIPLLERLLSPKRARKPRVPKEVNPVVQNDFLMRQMAHDAEKRRKENLREQKKTKTPNAKKPEIFDKLYRESIAHSSSEDEPVPTSRKSTVDWTDRRWWEPKPVAQPPAPPNPDDFRDARFDQRSQELTQDTLPFMERESRDFCDVIEDYRASQMEKRKISEYFSHLDK